MSYSEDVVQYARGEIPATCKCHVCGKEYEYRRVANTSKNTCGDCMTNRHRFTLKAKMVQYKGGCCQVCGYDRCLAALDFHHVDPSQKELPFNGAHCRAVSKLAAELDKCVCLCSNCHREVHAALEDVEWGHEPAPILDLVANLHAEWEPPPLSVLEGARAEWKDYHPKFNDRGKPFAFKAASESNTARSSIRAADHTEQEFCPPDARGAI